jgi:adenylate cyclase
MGGGDRAAHSALAAERLRNARRINAFRFVGLLLAGAVEALFVLTVPGWIGAPRGLLIGWTLAAGALFVSGVRSERVARVGSLAIALVDMPMLLLVVSRIIDAQRAAGLIGDASRLSAHVVVYYIGLLTLASLALDRRRLTIAAAIAVACEVALMLRSGSWDKGVMVMTILGIALIGAVLAYASGRSSVLVERVADEQRHRERLQRYFSPQVAARLAESSVLAASGQTREVTILFCDLRDFTPLAEAMPAPDVVALLNAFFERTVDVIFAHGGTLDKYLGDGLMAYFGAPVPQPDHATRAVRCAVAMRAALAAFSAERGGLGEPPLRIGIGVHTGTVVLGDIGTPQRRDYTIVGDAVNVAARLHELTKVEDVLVSDATRQQLGDGIALSAPRAVHVRGRRAPLGVSVPVA